MCVLSLVYFQERVPSLHTGFYCVGRLSLRGASNVVLHRTLQIYGQEFLSRGPANHETLSKALKTTRVALSAARFLMNTTLAIELSHPKLLGPSPLSVVYISS